MIIVYFNVEVYIISLHMRYNIEFTRLIYKIHIIDNFIIIYINLFIILYYINLIVIDFVGPWQLNL